LSDDSVNSITQKFFFMKLLQRTILWTTNNWSDFWGRCKYG